MATVAKETFGFQTEVKQLLQLMIHSLYSNKEIFLRELLSNASDAVDKLRFEALQNSGLLENDQDLKVWISIDKEAKTLTIRDNGIGMSKEEVIQNLGTIAKSGTKEFLSRLTGNEAKDANLIGQFGVGFYASFMVADKVVVTTRRAGTKEDEAVRWSSTGEGEYELEMVSFSKRGTEIVLHLKKEEEEFLNDWRLRHVIKKYSDHLALPIIMKNTKEEEETINQATALWTLAKNEITEAQYKEFYKHIAHDFVEPLAWSHNKVEGNLEYTSLLYIPSKASFDLFTREKAKGLKLYIKRVFIMDDVQQFLPNYLRFVRGIIDCNDLPLNISRELLQNHRVIDTIKTALTKRILGMLEELAQTQEKYQSFWQEFGQVLKEGLIEDVNNKEQIANLLRFSTTHTNQETQTVSLTEYINRMPSEQDKVYYIIAQTFNTAKHSPHLEVFKRKGIEVLLLSDRIDEWLVTNLTTFKEKALQSITQANLELDKLADEQITKEYKEKEESFVETLNKIKEVLKEDIKEVRLSQRLIDSPACIVTDEQGFSLQMEKLMQSADQSVSIQKPILELNPSHPIIEQLKEIKEQEKFEDWVHILLDQSILAEGGQLEAPAQFVKRFNKLLTQLKAA